MNKSRFKGAGLTLASGFASGRARPTSDPRTRLIFVSQLTLVEHLSKTQAQLKQFKLGTCRDGGNPFTPERYRLELNSAHTFTGRQAPSDPHTVSGVFFLRKQN